MIKQNNKIKRNWCTIIKNQYCKINLFFFIKDKIEFLG